jgi:hypothetical protein
MLAIVMFIIWIPIALFYLVAATLFRLGYEAHQWAINTSIWASGEAGKRGRQNDISDPD